MEAGVESLAGEALREPRVALAAAWGEELKEDENPAGQTVALPQRLQDQSRAGPRLHPVSGRHGTRHGAAHAVVLAPGSRLPGAVEQCQLLDSLHDRPVGARAVYDYVDDHFYVDHPQFLQGPGACPAAARTPARSPEEPRAGGAITFTRLFDKPFTVTEYNYSGPRSLSRRGRHSHRRAGRTPGLGRNLALCLQPQPRSDVHAVARWVTSTWPPTRSARPPNALHCACSCAATCRRPRTAWPWS